jgi:threonine aldolase
MRQAGFLAAAGLYALQNHVDRLLIDHMHAKALGETLRNLPWVSHVAEVETNIVIFQVAAPLTSASAVNKLQQKGIHCFAFGPDKLRFVTHLDNTAAQMDFALATLAGLNTLD